MVAKEKIEKNPEIGLSEIERMMKQRGATIIRIFSSPKFWHVVYKK